MGLPLLEVVFNAVFSAKYERKHEFMAAKMVWKRIYSCSWVRHPLWVIVKPKSSFTSRKKKQLDPNLKCVHTFGIGEIWGYTVFCKEDRYTKKRNFF